MKRQDLLNKFPLEFEITQDIINNADVYDIDNCIGALSLKKALGFEHVTWAADTGSLHYNDKENSLCFVDTISTEEGINMMEVTEPQKVTFIVQNN